MSTSKASTVILVHGAFQNANAWLRATPKIEARGWKVVAVNLLGRDGDGTDPQTLTTEHYKNAVLNVVSAEAKPVLLVGHSFGGITIFEWRRGCAGRNRRGRLPLGLLCRRMASRCNRWRKRTQIPRSAKTEILWSRLTISTPASSRKTAPQFLATTQRLPLTLPNRMR